MEEKLGSLEEYKVDIGVKAVLSHNMTLVYGSLDLQAVDSSKLKTLASIQGRPMLVDTPEMIVATYPAEQGPIVIQLADRRIRITFAQRSTGIDKSSIWNVAFECDRLASGSSLIAYGFNYDVIVGLANGNASGILVDLFIRDPDIIQTALQGYLSSFIPRLKFRREQVSCDMVLEPTDDQNIKAHLNSHFEYEDIALPAPEQLKVSFCKEYEYLVSMLPRLLEGDY